MSESSHAISCPTCGGVLFREDKIVQLDSTVVIRENLPIAARTLHEQYRYTCLGCQTILHYEWSPQDLDPQNHE
jgi:hypothetical protein